MSRYCLHRKSDNFPPCIELITPKYSYLRDMINDSYRTLMHLSVAADIDCINLSDGIEINQNCISCMFCLFACPTNLIHLTDTNKLIASCSEFQGDVTSTQNANHIHNLLNGSFINLPRIIDFRKGLRYKCFEEFTAIRETHNISVWGGNALNFLSSNPDSRLGLEVGLEIKALARGGRMDICLLSDNILFVAESKISLVDMLNENRFISQLIAYEGEIQNVRDCFDKSFQHHKFLLIGGSEFDLLPVNDAHRSLLHGGYTETFYDLLYHHDFFFISANALLALGLKKLLIGDQYSLENVSMQLFSPGNYGLVSSGLVRYDGADFIVEPFRV